MGFAERSDFLLAVSHDGRGLFDALSGKRLARDDSALSSAWLKEVPYEATGIGVLGSAVVRLGGVLGGGLARITRDGWHLELIPVDWPNHTVFLEPPGSSILVTERSSSCSRIDVTEELRALRFFNRTLGRREKSANRL